MAFEHKEELVVGLYDREAIMFQQDGWTLKSGRLASHYFDQRPITSFSSTIDMPIDRQRRVRDLAVEGYSEAIDRLGVDYDHLFGIPQSLTSLAAMVAHARGDSIIWERVGEKTYGVMGVPFQGFFSEGDRVVSLDDVITNAHSKLDSAEKLGKHMLLVNGFVIMLDREEGGMEALRSAGYEDEALAVTSMSEVFAILEANDRTGPQEREWVTAYYQGLVNDKKIPVNPLL